MIVEVHKSIRRLGYRARGRCLLRTGINVIEPPLTRNEERLIQQLAKMKLAIILDPENPEHKAKLDAAKVAFFHEAMVVETVDPEDTIAPEDADDTVVIAARSAKPMRMRRRVRRVDDPNRNDPPPRRSRAPRTAPPVEPTPDEGDEANGQDGPGTAQESGTTEVTLTGGETEVILPDGIVPPVVDGETEIIVDGETTSLSETTEGEVPPPERVTQPELETDGGDGDDPASVE